MKPYLKIVLILFIFKIIKCEDTCMSLNDNDQVFLDRFKEMETSFFERCQDRALPMLKHVANSQPTETKNNLIHNLTINQETLTEKVNSLNTAIKSKDNELELQQRLIESLQSIKQFNEFFDEKNKSEAKVKHLENQLSYLQTLKEMSQSENKEKLEDLQTKYNIAIRDRNELETNLKSEIDILNRIIIRKDTEIQNMKSALEQHEEKTNKYLEVSCLNKPIGLHQINLSKTDNFPILCDSTLSSTGWTVIQRRQFGNTHFNKTWDAYKTGFGDLNDDFFIGLESLYQILKSQPHKLHILLNGYGQSIHIEYDDFEIGNEETSYKIQKLSNYKGPSRSPIRLALNMKFVTQDHDTQFLCMSLNSGWWMDSKCESFNPNGLYYGQYGVIVKSSYYTFIQIMVKPSA